MLESQKNSRLLIPSIGSIEIVLDYVFGISIWSTFLLGDFLQTVGLSGIPLISLLFFNRCYVLIKHLYQHEKVIRSSILLACLALTTVLSIKASYEDYNDSRNNISTELLIYRIFLWTCTVAFISKNSAKLSSYFYYRNNQTIINPTSIEKYDFRKLPKEDFNFKEIQAVITQLKKLKPSFFRSPIWKISIPGAYCRHSNDLLNQAIQIVRDGQVNQVIFTKKEMPAAERKLAGTYYITDDLRNPSRILVIGIKNSGIKDQNILGQLRVFTDNKNDEYHMKSYAPGWFFKSVDERDVPKNSVREACCKKIFRH